MKICVYGASSNAINPDFLKVGEELGRALAQNGDELIFGGGQNGMMGAVALGVYNAGGKITGIAPKFFDVDGILFEHCDRFLYPESMRERKRMLEEISDGFIVTPGGIGTLDEFFEIVTLKQLGRHQKPIIIFNINGYFDAMLLMIDQAIEMNFITDQNRKLYFVANNTCEILKYFAEYIPENTKIFEFKEIENR